MKAIVYTKYGSPDVLRLEDVETPTPKDNEVLINIHTTTVTAGDLKAREADPFFLRFIFGLTRPKSPILGSEFAGRVEQVGSNVTQFEKGDRVFGTTMDGGTYAEYICVPEDSVLATIPANRSFEEAAAGPSGALVVMQGLQKHKVQIGQKVLIYGASGSLGTAAVQLAKHFGAEVTGVCSTANLELVTSLGADAVIDYTTDDYADNGKTYDIILDVVGKSSFSTAKGSLNPTGVYLSSWPTRRLVLQVIRTSIFGRKKARLLTEFPKLESLTFLKELLEAGEVEMVIDRSYPLAQTAEAHTYVEKGHKKGNVIVAVETASQDLNGTHDDSTCHRNRSAGSGSSLDRLLPVARVTGQVSR